MWLGHVSFVLDELCFFIVPHNVVSNNKGNFHVKDLYKKAECCDHKCYALKDGVTCIRWREYNESMKHQYHSQFRNFYFRLEDRDYETARALETLLRPYGHDKNYVGRLALMQNAIKRVEQYAKSLKKGDEQEFLLYILDCIEYLLDKHGNQVGICNLGPRE